MGAWRSLPRRSRGGSRSWRRRARRAGWW
uniref:Uncharacterized protein n=1 Tax=Arundo donax TaxID=35708 RepID=A0A0A9F741_ARUDO